MVGFSEKVAHLVEGHVLVRALKSMTCSSDDASLQAKRYLCFKEPEYLANLSPGSARTLTFQGLTRYCII